jgi:hypothetical protein
MTGTPSAECNGSGMPLMLAFDLGSTEWTLGFSGRVAVARPTLPQRAPCVRERPAADYTLPENAESVARMSVTDLGARAGQVPKRGLTMLLKRDPKL